MNRTETIVTYTAIGLIAAMVAGLKAIEAANAYLTRKAAPKPYIHPMYRSNGHIDAQFIPGHGRKRRG